MDVVHVALEICIIANGVLPISALPQTSLTFAEFARRTRSFNREAAREAALDQVPANGKICISGREGPHCMQVIRQDAYRKGFERMSLLDGAVDIPEMIDMPNEEIARSIRKGDGEEEHAALNLGTTIPRHAAILS